MLDRTEDGERLAGEGDAVSAPHLRLVRRYGPDRLVEVDIRPFGEAQLPRAHKDVGQQPQSRVDVCAVLERFDRAQQRASLSGRCDGGAMDRLRHDQGAAQVTCDIPVGPRRCDGVPEHLRAGAAKALGGLVTAFALHLAEHKQKLLRGDRGDGALAD